MENLEESNQRTTKLREQRRQKEEEHARAVKDKYWRDMEQITKQAFEETKYASDFVVWLKMQLAGLRWVVTLSDFRHPAWIRYNCLMEVWAVRLHNDGL